MANSDEGLASTVKAALSSDRRISGLPISVEAHGKVVVLKGRADSQEHRREAEFLARGVPGVREVINEIAVSY